MHELPLAVFALIGQGGECWADVEVVAPGRHRMEAGAVPKHAVEGLDVLGVEVVVEIHWHGILVVLPSAGRARCVTSYTY